MKPGAASSFLTLACTMLAGASSSAQISPSGSSSQAIYKDPIRPAASSLLLVNSDSIDRERSNQLRVGMARGQTLLLRSSSTLTAPTADSSRAWRAAGIAPQFLAV